MNWFSKFTSTAATPPPPIKKTRKQELLDEYFLVTKALKRLHEARGRNILDGLSPPIIASVKANLIAKRAELELMIDVLED